MATGKEEYYVLARNLLLSYKYHSRSPMPFAIICDKENEYTALFDKVVIMDAPLYSIYDKLRLPELAPYDETIFIEPDCLAYRNLNGLWKVFKDAPDFSGLGADFPLDDERGWLRPECLGKYQDVVKGQFQMQGGVLFLRRGRLDGFALTCMDIYKHRDEYRFRLENEESIFVLASLIHGFRPMKDWIEVFCYYPAANITRMDIRRGRLSFILKEYNIPSKPGVFLVHWGTLDTRSDPYLREAGEVLSLMERHRHSSLFLPVRISLEKVWHSLKRRTPSPVKIFLSKSLASRNG